MQFSIRHSIEILERTPDVLARLTQGLSDDWTRQNEGGESWSVFDVVGHLVHGEITDWIPRAEIILSDKDNKTFEPFDRFAQFETSKGKSLDDLLMEFKYLRAVNLSKLRDFQITDADLQKTGIHPSFGIVTLEQLLSTWVVHDLNHIVQISRVMAKQYKESCGPWNAFLSVLGQSK